MIGKQYIAYLLCVISLSSIAQGRLWNRGTIQLDAGTEARVHGNIILDAPVTGDGYLTFAGSTSAQADGIQLQTDHFRMESAAPLVLKTDFTITQQADFLSGVLDIQANDLVFETTSPATGGNASSYIQTSGAGWVRFPVNSNAASLPLGINTFYIHADFSQSGTADTFSVQLWPALTDNGSGTGNALTSHVSRWALEIVESIPGQNDVSISLQWPDASLAAGFFEPQTALIFYNGSAYVPLSLCGTDLSSINPNTLQSTGLQEVGVLGVGDSLFLPPQPQAIITAAGSTAFCQGDSVLLQASSALNYLWNNGSSLQNIYVTASGSYQVTVSDANGCQSVSAPVLISVFPIDSMMQYQTSCNSYEWSATGQTYQTGGTYIVSLQNQHGCDSIITLQLTLLFSDTLHQNFSICPGSSVTVGSNTYDTDGIYTDVFTASNGCDSVVITTVEVLGCSGLISFDEPVITVYPNPAHEQIAVLTNFDFPNIAYSIKDVHGRNVLSGNFLFQENSPVWIDIKALSYGVYFLHIHNYVTRFIKK